MSANLSDRARSVNNALRRNANAGDRTPARSTSPTDFTEARKALPPGIFDPDQDARLFVEPESIIDDSPERLKKLRKTISEVHNATSSGFAQIGLPLRLRTLVSAIIAAANGEKQFQASYTTLVRLLFRDGDGRTFEAKKSEVRRLVKALVVWQEKTKISLCTIRPGGRTIEKGVEEYHDTEFELVFLDALAKALLRNPAPERMRATVRMEMAAMMKLPPFDSRWQVQPPPLDKMRERNRKAALTKAAKAIEATEKLHGNPLAYAKALADEIVRQASEKYGETSGRDNAEEPPSIESAEVEAQGGVSDPTHPPTPQEKPEPERAVQKVAPIQKKEVTKNTHTQSHLRAAGAPDVVVGQGSKFSSEDCLRYANHLHTTGQGITNPGGFATTIYKSGVQDHQIASWLAGGDPERVQSGAPPAPQIELTTNPPDCPDCNGSGWYERDPQKKLYARCPHPRLKKEVIEGKQVA